MPPSPVNRRGFVIGGAIASVGIGCGTSEEGSPQPNPEGAPPGPPAATSPAPPPEKAPRPNLPPVADPSLDPTALPTRAFGKTGAKVTILGLGGAHSLMARSDLAFSVIQRAYDQGIRFFDTAPLYEQNQANLGEVLGSKRSSIFIQSKTYARTRDGVLRELEVSLKAMKTSYVDAYLMHDVRRHDEIDKILAPNGALKAYIEAVEQKMVRYIGASVHCFPDILQRLVEAHPLDCATMSLNAADSYDRPFATTILPILNRKQMGVAAIKPLGYGRLLPTISTSEAFGWVLSHPVSTALVGANAVAEIDENTQIARAFTPLAQATLDDITVRVKDVAHDSLFFRWSDSHTK